MSRILCIDYGLKRVGIAVTDKLLLISYPLVTVEKNDLFKFLDDYFAKEEVDRVVVGDPVIYGSECNIMDEIDNFVCIFKSKYQKEVVLFNERYTTNIAKYCIYNDNMSKKNKRDKGLLNKVSSAVILESYLNSLKKSNIP